MGRIHVSQMEELCCIDFSLPFLLLPTHGLLSVMGHLWSPIVWVMQDSSKAGKLDVLLIPPLVQTLLLNLCSVYSSRNEDRG